MQRRLWLALSVLALVAVVTVAVGTRASREKQPLPASSTATTTEERTGDPAGRPYDPTARRSENFQIVDDSTEGISMPPDEVARQPVAEAVTNALVTRVKDGDTLVVKLDGGEEATIRLLGVNTPETVDPRKPVECFGKQASDFTKSKLHDARVRLDADPQADERDKYGRLLRNLTLEDGTDFNALLIQEGYAYAYLSFPLDPERKRELKQLETEAKEAGRGLWGEGTCER